MSNARTRLVGLAAATIAGAACLLLLQTVLFPFVVVSHRHTLPMEQAAGNALVSLAARIHGGSQRNPYAHDPGALAAGTGAFQNCVLCHGLQGDGRGPLSNGLYPPPADLRSPEVQRLSDAQLFWVINNGLSYTAMPAYGSQIPDRDIWQIVTYLRTLPQEGG
jgi:mono/diheme cytochrome c family protein